MAKHSVVFQPVGAKIEVEPGTHLLEAASEAGVYINSLCGGEGVCGKCRLQVTRGEAKPSSHSIRFLSRDEINTGSSPSSCPTRCMTIDARFNERVSASRTIICRLNPGVDSLESRPSALR